MRVGIDAHMLGDHSGGNERYYTNLLKNIKTEKEDVLIIFVKEGVDVSYLNKSFIIVRFKSKGAFTRNFFEISYFCKKYKLDILYTQYFIPFYRPCPVVCTIHDICFEHFSNIFTKKEYLRQKTLIPYAAKKSELIYTVSEYSKNDICKCYKINEKKVRVTFNAVDKEFKILNKQQLREDELRQKFNIGQEKYILTVGNLQPRKNLPRLIQAFICYKKKYGSKEKLIIVGKKAWMYEEIIKVALEWQQDIIFTDYIGNEDLIRLYNAAEGFVYPSFFEGFGIPPLESMACGTPVAVSRATSLPEVVGDAGLYFDPFSENEIEEAIYQLLKADEKQREIWVKKGLERVKKFSWQKTADSVMKGFKDCLNGL